MSFDVLIVDDEADICDLVSGILSDEGYTTRTALTGIEAINLIDERQPNLVILDVWLGDGTRDGLKILEIIKQDHQHIPVIMMSGHSTIETAVASIKLGAYNFIEKPFKSEQLLLISERAIETSLLKKENEELKVRAPFICSLVGSSSAIQGIKQTIDSTSQTNSKIFISSPVGGDRVSIAKYIHCSSNIANHPFLSINCSSYNENLLEKEIFGLETISDSVGNLTKKIGLLENAHGGTFFIDDIHILPLSVQSKLNNFLKDQSFCRVGGRTRVKVDVRILSGSSKKNSDLLFSNLFMDELFYRLSVVYVEIPPLSERVRDIQLLAKHFISAIALAQNVTARNLSNEALAIFETYQWPGDIQQFKNVLEWILIMGNGKRHDLIEAGDLPPEIILGNDFSKKINNNFQSITSLTIKEAREEFEKEYLLSQLKRFNKNISQTAKFIGMDRASLHRKLKLLNISFEEDKD